MSQPIIPPGRTIGIVGGGQLGRMTAMAAARLGYRTLVLSPEDDPPAASVAATLKADYGDGAALQKLTELCDVVTYEFENVPAEPISWLAERVPVRPSAKILRICQDRLREKDFLHRHGLPVTRYRAVTSFQALAGAAADIGRPAVLKTARMGYDGKGQVKVDEETNLGEAWRRLNTDAAILERFVEFRAECSVIVARSLDGHIACWDVAENQHENHILSQTSVPAPSLSDGQRREAQALAVKLAEALELEGLLCVEMFVDTDGALLVNELAPRPHNSGHWTLDAAVTNQFEQLVRAICGLPLGSTERLCPAVMRNLIGDEVGHWYEALSNPRAKLHLYGKNAVMPGRKMGHVTFLGDMGIAAPPPAPAPAAKPAPPPPPPES